ncbi:MAG: hypothetical protein JSR77_17630 [Planctomycetes bacterium]|nr:hypothetical protein [Planctomycetota bacterium]
MFQTELFTSQVGSKGIIESVYLSEYLHHQWKDQSMIVYISCETNKEMGSWSNICRIFSECTAVLMRDGRAGPCITMIDRFRETRRGRLHDIALLTDRGLPGPDTMEQLMCVVVPAFGNEVDYSDWISDAKKYSEERLFRRHLGQHFPENSLAIQVRQGAQLEDMVALCESYFLDDKGDHPDVIMDHIMKMPYVDRVLMWREQDKILYLIDKDRARAISLAREFAASLVRLEDDEAPPPG